MIQKTNVTKFTNTIFNTIFTLEIQNSKYYVIRYF